jgi:hypothetical protein
MAKKKNEGNPGKKNANVTPTFSEADAKKVVHKINKVARKTVEKGCMDIGDVVLEDVFQGSLDEVCSKDPFKSNALVLVCKDPELMVNRRRLGEWVRAAHLCKELKAKKVDCTFLSYSHFAALLKLDDEKKCVELATSANKEQWSARELAKKIGKKKAARSIKEDAGNQPQVTDITRAKAEQLMRTAGEFLALMQEEETQRLLEDPQELKDRMAYDIRIQFAHWVDQFVSKMSDSTNLLKVAKRNIRRIEAEALGAPEDDVIEVAATAL